jgi:hypothetical protein
VSCFSLLGDCKLLSFVDVVAGSVEVCVFDCVESCGVVREAIGVGIVLQRYHKNKDFNFIHRRIKTLSFIFRISSTL